MRAICEGRLEEKLRAKAAVGWGARAAARKVEANMSAGGGGNWRFAREYLNWWIERRRAVWRLQLFARNKVGCLLTMGRDVYAAVRRTGTPCRFGLGLLGSAAVERYKVTTLSTTTRPRH